MAHGVFGEFSGSYQSQGPFVTVLGVCHKHAYFLLRAAVFRFAVLDSII